MRTNLTLYYMYNNKKTMSHTYAFALNLVLTEKIGSDTQPCLPCMKHKF